MEHVVARGETLSSIAARYSIYGVTVASIAQANNLVNPNFIYAGQRLKIPAYTTDGGVTYGTGAGGWTPTTTPASPNGQAADAATLAAIAAAKKKKEDEQQKQMMVYGGLGLVLLVVVLSSR